MRKPFIVEGVLYAPYFIFLRCAGRYSDSDLLQRFGLTDYRPTEASTHSGRWAILADDGEWTVIADDWYYTLWNMRSTLPAIEDIGRSCDTFACSAGDCDHSYYFAYYREGLLVRKYVVADPDFRGGIVTEDVGEPLPGESTAFKHADELMIVLDIAASLGIRTDYTEGELRFYAPSKPDRIS